MRARHVVMLGAAALASAAAAPLAGQRAARAGVPEVRVVPRAAERRVDVLVGGRPFTAYVYPAALKKPVLYPVRTAAGTPVTRGWPLERAPRERVDHPHHVGLWFNYGDVNGLDFWNNSDAIPAAQAPTMGTVVHRAVRKAESGRGVGALEVTAEWRDASGKALLREDTRFEFRALPDAVGRGGRVIDRITTLTALDDPVRFTDNKEGLIGLRVARALEQPATRPEILTDAQGRPAPVPVLDNEGVTGRYRSAEGLEGDSVWGTRARWARLSGTVGGEPVTVAILDHPKNVGFPTYWHARGYGLFAANNLGQKAMSNGQDALDLHLASGASTTFRHRVLILSEAATPDAIERHYREFTR